MAKGISGVQKIISIPKGTSIGRGNLKTSSMPKAKKANFKKYRGQGK